MSTTEQDIDDDDRGLLREILQAYESGTAMPEVARFRVQHAAHRARIDALQARGFLEENLRRYYLTLDGLRACDSPEARTAYGRCETLLSELQSAHLDQPTKLWEALEFGDRVQRSREEISRLLTLMKGIPGIITRLDNNTGFLVEFRIDERTLDATLPPWPGETAAAETAKEVAGESRLVRLEISGYRPFATFAADLAPLTVIIGANAAGKSSLFDALRLITFAAENPLPAIDPRNTSVSALFHAGGPERIDLALAAGLGLPHPLRYEVSIHGPVATPRVARERLTTAPLEENGKVPFVLLDFSGGKGTVRDPRERALTLAPWSIPPNELALRQVSHPLRTTLYRFQRFVASWRFYINKRSRTWDGARAASRGALPTPRASLMRRTGGAAYFAEHHSTRNLPLSPGRFRIQPTSGAKLVRIPLQVGAPAQPDRAPSGTEPAP